MAMRKTLGEMSEQDRLIANMDESTSDLIWSELRQKLGGTEISPEVAKRVREEIDNSEDVIEESQVKPKRSIKKDTLPSNISTEKMLYSLFEIHDGLIETFELSELDSPISKKITDLISHMEDCIQYLGGKIEIFEPIKHVSGLDVPDFFKNAQKVLDTTIACYKMGEVVQSNIEDDGKTINIVFAGSNKDIIYNASGIIIADNWNGNEAIDFIYTKNGGKMSVKVFENGRWNDKSESGNYGIRYDLEEVNINDVKKYQENMGKEEQEIATDEDTTVVENNKIENLEKKDKEIKEVLKVEKNYVSKVAEGHGNLEDLDSDLNDFPIIGLNNNETDNNK